MKVSERISRIARLLALAATTLAVTLGYSAAAPDNERDHGDSHKRPLIIAKQGNFFVGGHHNASDQVVGQMYVESQ
jgi:hypothetical protein